MKRIKIERIFCLLLALLLLAGCAASPVDTQSTQTEGTKETDSPDVPLVSVPDRPLPTIPELNVSRQLLPAAVDNPENLPVLKWVCLTDSFGGGNRIWSEDAAVELNQMLSDKKLPFRVQLVLCTVDHPVTDAGVIFELPEVQEDLQSADLIYGFMSGDDAKKLLMPITEYVTGTAEPSLKSTLPHNTCWHDATLDDEIYGVPTILKFPDSLGWKVNRSFMEKEGLTDADFQKSFWEMDSLFAGLYEKNGKKAFLHLNSDGYSRSTNNTSGLSMQNQAPSVVSEALWNYFAACGMIFGIDYHAENPVVVNILDTDFSRNMQQAAKRYRSAGYTANTYGDTDISWGQTYGHKVSDILSPRKVRIIPVTDSTYNFADRLSPLHMNGVAKNSRYQKEALLMLKLLGEDREVMMQLAYGKEGRDYTIDENGYYNLVIRDDGTDYSLSHLNMMSSFCGIQISENTPMSKTFNASLAAYPIYEGKTFQETHQEAWDNMKPSYIVPFDYTGFETELAAIEKVCKKYFFTFSRISTNQYNQMIEEMNAAGADRILDSLQKQYDQWKKDNPDKVN